MVGILEFLSAPGSFTGAVRADPFAPHWITGAAYKLHSMTGTVLFLSSCLIFIKEALGDHIHCIQDGGGEGVVSPAAFDSYCYISSTFTLPPEEVRAQFEQTYPGVGVHIDGRQNPYNSYNLASRVGPGAPRHHNYYQWISYLLFLQSVSFLAPLTLHRFFQDGRVQKILIDLNNLVLSSETREDKYGEIDVFIRDWSNRQDWWAVKTVSVDALNLVNVVLNLFFVDWYLDGAFFTYAPEAIRYFGTSPEKRGPDPFDLVFPKLTKCTLNTFGPSGTIQNRDALCVLPVNVLNEKIFFLLWFVLIILAAFTVLHHAVAAVVLSFRCLRKKYLLLYVSPKRKETRLKLSQILDLTGFGDWLVLFMIARNTDRVVFGEVIDYVKFPDYDWDLEPLDEENLTLVEGRRRGILHPKKRKSAATAKSSKLSVSQEDFAGE